jgi:hypothetical protein
MSVGGAALAPKVGEPVSEREEPATESFDPYTPPWLDEELGTLCAHTEHLCGLQLSAEIKACHCCPWCSGSVCATREKAESDTCPGCWQ